MLCSVLTGNGNSGNPGVSAYLVGVPSCLICHRVTLARCLPSLSLSFPKGAVGLHEIMHVQNLAQCLAEKPNEY